MIEEDEKFMMVRDDDVGFSVLSEGNTWVDADLDVLRALPTTKRPRRFSKSSWTEETFQLLNANNGYWVPRRNFLLGVRIMQKVEEMGVEGVTQELDVLVGNIGTVYRGLNAFEAAGDFIEYVDQSMRQYGRAAGEDVGLYYNSDPIFEHAGAYIDTGFTIKRSDLLDVPWDDVDAINPLVRGIVEQLLINGSNGKLHTAMKMANDLQLCAAKFSRHLSKVYRKASKEIETTDYENNLPT